MSVTLGALTEGAESGQCSMYERTLFLLNLFYFLTRLFFLLSLLPQSRFAPSDWKTLLTSLIYLYFLFSFFFLLTF